MLTIKKQVNNSTLTLSINGILDYSSIGNFHEHIETTGISKIIISFSDMEFIDSTGIGAILEIIHLGNENNISVELEDLSEAAKEIFDIIGVFQIQEALRKGGI